MIKLSREKYLDKLHACWLGKNIGGTIGTPYEGTREYLCLDGFTTPKGEPLPNDDLDLQLVWLAALELSGVKGFSTNVLAEYWMDWIPPHWNEYGIAKTNLSLGLLPPMSGEVDNDRWKTSNGAWIRSELWAGLAPGIVDVAVKYAVMDAMVDHGISEGTVAEIFTAALQSMAYIESDIVKLIEAALSKITPESMVARTVRLVMELYRSGASHRDTRDRVVEFNKELGWFQAPANIGFVVIGLLFGEGDFKRSVLCAVNCGDDTDCTAATVGAIMGIRGGTKCIPDDWRDFVGDMIVTKSISCMYNAYIPKSCTALTARVAALVPEVMKENGAPLCFAEDDDIPQSELEKFNLLTDKELLDRAPNSYDICDSRTVTVRLELDGSPRIAPGETRGVTLSFIPKRHIRQTHKFHLKLILPEGWSSEGMAKTLSLEYAKQEFELYRAGARASFTITAPESVDDVNRAYVEITAPTIAAPIIVPITLIG